MQSQLRAVYRMTATRPLGLLRSYHGTAGRLAFKNPQHRATLSPRTDENTKSARDDDVAALSEAPYCRNKARPEDEMLAAEQESMGRQNPLEASGADKDFSNPSADMITGKYVSIRWEEESRERSRYGGTPGKGAKLRVHKIEKNIKFRA